MKDLERNVKYKGCTINLSKVGPMIHSTVDIDGETVFHQSYVTVEMATIKAKDFINSIPKIRSKR